MGRPATGPLVAYNVLSACVMVVETFLAGVVTEEADLVRHPLRVTGVLTGSVVVGGLCLHGLTGAQGVRVSYTFIDTVSESDGRPDGQCGGRGSVTTRPDRGPGCEGKLYLYRYGL